MAFNPKALQVLSGYGSTGVSSGLDKTFREARYITDENAAAVEGAGYFNNAAARLPKGTAILCILEHATTPALKWYVVTANTGSAVTIAEQTVTHPEGGGS